MRFAVSIHAIFITACLGLSLNAQDLTGGKTGSIVEKNNVKNEKAADVPASKDIRDTDIRDLKDEKQVKKTTAASDKKPAAKTTKKTARKKVRQTEGKSAGKKKTADKKADKSKGDGLILSLRDSVVNNRIFDVKTVLNDPERRASYNIDAVITPEDGRKTTLLCDAVSRNYADMTGILLGAGADINFAASDGGAPLHITAAMNNTAMARFLLQKGADVNVKDARGDTPLLTALRAGHFEAANLLVMKGADSAAVNLSGSTTIIEAVRGGNIECVRLILAQNRKDINRADTGGDTPLYLAMKRNDNVLMRLLRDSGASDSRVTVPDVTFGDLVAGTYAVKEYGRVTPGTRPSADDTTAAFSYIFLRDGTGIIDMNDPSKEDMKFRWRAEGNAVILEELDGRGYVSRRLRFMFIQTGGTVTFEKSDVEYGDVSAKRLEITKLAQ